MYREIRVYDRQRVYKFTIHRENLDGDIVFSSSDTGFGPLDITYTGTETLAIGDILKVYDGNSFLYSGYVVTLSPRLNKRDSFVQVGCLGLQTLLASQLYLYLYEADNVDYSFTRSGVDPATIIREAVERAPYNVDYTRTNVLEDINDLTSGAWTRTNVSTLSASITAPDGSTISDYFDFSTSAITNGISQTEPAISVNNKTYVVRAWVRSDAGNRDFRFELHNLGAITSVSGNFTADATWRLFSYTVKFGTGGSGGVKASILQSSPTSTVRLYIRGMECFDASDCSVELYGSNTSIDFDSTNCLDAIKKVKEVTGWNVSYDGDGNIYFYEPVTTLTPDHYISEEKYIRSIEYKKDMSELCNKLFLKYSSSTVTSTDATSISTYGEKQKYIDKSTEITSATTAQARADTFISKNKDPLEYIRIVVNNNYPSAINVGDLVEIQNNTLDIPNSYVMKADYNSDNTTIYLSSYESIQKSLLKLS